MSKTKWYQKPIYPLIALVLALLTGTPLLHQVAASPDQATFYSTTADGRLITEGGDYTAVHGASTAGSVYPNDIHITVGQQTLPVVFWVSRGALFLDTSSLPDDATIISAVLSLYGSSDASLVDFHITVVDGSVLHEPLALTDYGTLGSQTMSGGAFDTAGFSTSSYNDIPLNETGMGWISKTGISKFGLRSSREIAAIAPTTQEVVTIYPYERGPGYQPRLVVTYTTAPPPVGGEAYPVNKISALAPLIAVAVLVAGGLSWYAFRRRKARS